MVIGLVIVILYLRVQMNMYLDFPYFLTSLYEVR